MEIILLEKVTNLGGLGDIVKVKDGYARNFLIPSGRARRATAANKAEFEARRAELEKQAAENWPLPSSRAESWLAPSSSSRKRLASMAACSAPSPTTTLPKS